MSAAPPAPPVTGTLTLVPLVGNVTVCGTDATLASLELSVTVNPGAGAGTDRLSVTGTVVPPVTLRFGWEKLRAALT